MEMTRRRYVEGVEPGKSGAWLGDESFSELERSQLTEIATNWAPQLEGPEALELFLTGDYAAFAKTFDEMAGVPLEQWDVMDGDEPVFHLWLYQVDAGVLYRGGTAEVVGIMIQNGFEFDEDFDEDLADELGDELEAARVRAVQATKEARAFPCSLKSYRFAR